MNYVRIGADYCHKQVLDEYQRFTACYHRRPFTAFLFCIQMRTLLLILIVFVALSASVTGVLMICYPDGFLLGVPARMIEASPFEDLVMPGIILAFGVGGIHFIALLHFRDHTIKAYNWCMAAGLASCGWVAIQFVLVHTVMWIQGIYLLIGISTLLLSLQLRSKWLL